MYTLYLLKLYNGTFVDIRFTDLPLDKEKEKLYKNDTYAGLPYLYGDSALILTKIKDYEDKTEKEMIKLCGKYKHLKVKEENKKFFINLEQEIGNIQDNKIKIVENWIRVPKKVIKCNEENKTLIGLSNKLGLPLEEIVDIVKYHQKFGAFKLLNGSDFRVPIIGEFKIIKK